MARQRHDTAPEFRVSDDSVVIQQVAGSTAPLLEVKDHTGSALMTVNSAGQMSSASPSLTGTPTAPTAASGTNTTQIATTAFVQTEVANLVASAPAALNTLDELAAALGDDANFATTVTNSLATKAPLASPTFTGTVTLPSTTSIGNVSATEIGYVDGVTSAIQTQLNAKAPTASPTFTGNATFDSGTLFVDGTNDVVGVGTSSPSTGQYGDFGLDVYGRIRIRGEKSGGTAGVALGKATPTASYYNAAAFMGMEAGSDNGAVGFWHSGAWRFLVSNGGLVVKPYQPYYYGQLSGGNAVYTGVYNPGNVRLNNNSAMNTGNGRFTPIPAGTVSVTAGSVLCSFNSLINTPELNSHFYVYFTKNGTEVSQRQHTDYAHTRSYEPISLTAIIPVSAGDFIECYVVCQSNAGIYGAPWGGGLLYALL